MKQICVRVSSFSLHYLYISNLLQASSSALNVFQSYLAVDMEDYLLTEKETWSRKRHGFVMETFAPLCLGSLLHKKAENKGT